MAAEIDRLWRDIFSCWAVGKPYARQIAWASQQLARNAQDIAVGNRPAGYNWAADQAQAESLNQAFSNNFEHRQEQFESLYRNWETWATDSHHYAQKISLEGLRSMIIIHGAAILVSLTALSGQIQNVGTVVKTAAKIMMTFSTLGMIATAIGFSIIFNVVSVSANSTRWRLMRPIRPYRLKALSRFHKKNFTLKGKVGDYIAQSSIAFFIVGAAVCAVLLWSA